MPQDGVVILHGLSRRSASMNKIEKKLKKQGYYTVNVDYPSRQKCIEDLAISAIETALQKCQKNSHQGKIHFVTHSMGGIIVRYYLAHHKIEKLGRIVMLAPPNKGCHLVDIYRRWGILKMACGTSVLQLGTDKNSMPVSLPSVDYPVGIIAGNTDWPLFFFNKLFLKGANDGVVTIENTKVEGMQDFIEINWSHSFIVFSDVAIQQICHFLQNGCFNHQ